MRRSLALGFAFAFALIIAGCFNPKYSNGDLKCGAAAPQCPDGLHCAGDGTCWKNGQDPPLDLAAGPETPRDLSVGKTTDLGPADMGAADLLPDLELPPIDMGQPDGNHVVEATSAGGGAIDIKDTGTHQATLSFGQPLAGSASAAGDHSVQLGILWGTLSK